MYRYFNLLLSLFILSTCAKLDDNKTLEISFSNSKLSELPDLSHYKIAKILYADNNKLKNLHASIAKLQTLQELDISYNQFSELPDYLAELKNLKQLDLSHNKFTELPASVLTLVNLEVLDLRYNQLISLPDDIEKLQKLDAVYLFGNEFSEEKRQRFRKLLPLTKFVWIDTKIYK